MVQIGQADADVFTIERLKLSRNRLHVSSWQSVDLRLHPGENETSAASRIKNWDASCERNAASHRYCSEAGGQRRLLIPTHGIALCRRPAKLEADRSS